MAAMSDIVEKTLTALPGLFLQNQGGGGPTAARASFSSRLGGLIRGITALTSKHVRACRPGGRSGTPREAPRAARPWPHREPAGWPHHGAQGLRACRSIFESVWKRHFPARTDNWEAGFPQLALTLTPMICGQISNF